MDVGFIGLGQMGRAMATNLLKAGHRVVAYNRSRDKARPLEEAGAKIVDRPADAAHGDALITMLADDNAVEAVLFGDGGAFDALGENTIDLSMSTISVGLSERLTALHASKGRIYVAAPVLGRPDAAAAAKLFIMVAGPPQAIQRCRPLFEAMGQKTFTLGEKPPAANVVKLSANFLISSMLESLGEAFAFARKSGVDAHLLLDVITGSVFASPAYKTYGTIIADEKYEPVGFPMSMGLKDIRLALAAADAARVPMPLASLVHDHFLSGVAQGKGNADWASLARLCAESAGLR
ncbi:MAG TPA: NAD(P)-dependent oxidoreductase [Alphaproteobacteria bacterium]